MTQHCGIPASQVNHAALSFQSRAGQNKGLTFLLPAPDTSPSASK